MLHKSTHQFKSQVSCCTLTKQVAKCVIDIQLQYVGSTYSKVICTYFLSQRVAKGDNACPCQYLFGSTISWPLLLWERTWDGKLLWVTNFSIAFTHGGVDKSSTQSSLFVTLCLKPDLRFIYMHHNATSNMENQSRNICCQTLEWSN